jgi:hypothetical protein
MRYPVTFLTAAVLFLGLNELAVQAQQEDPFQHCQRVVTDDNPGPVPPSLIRAFARAFDMTPASVREGLTFGSFRYRCYQGTVMGCTVGANLNCERETQERGMKGRMIGVGCTRTAETFLPSRPAIQQFMSGTVLGPMRFLAGSFLRLMIAGSTP